MQGKTKVAAEQLIKSASRSLDLAAAALRNDQEGTFLNRVIHAQTELREAQRELERMYERRCIQAELNRKSPIIQPSCSRGHDWVDYPNGHSEAYHIS